MRSFMRIPETARLAGRVFSRWNDHEGQRLGAALAFYALLSAAPFAIFLLLLLSRLFGRAAVEDHMIDYARSTFGPAGGDITRIVITSSHKTAHGALAGGVALFTLLFGASSAFLELRDDLNLMWDARPRRSGLAGIILQRVFSFALVLAAGCLLLLSTLATAAVSLIAKYFASAAPIPPALLETVNFLISFVLLTGVFILIYRFVPDLVLPWRTLKVGAAVSALLFVAGKAALGIYLSRAGIGSAYGAAGSLIAVAFWVYYSAQIFLLGAEFTYLWHRRNPPPVQTAETERRAA